jgi:DNA-binding Lrp family transcriptional regulator
MPEVRTAVDSVDRRLIARLHGGLPLVDRPFAAVGAELGLPEQQVIERLQRLLDDGVLTRFGPLFQIERAGGQFVLAAMAVPAERFDAVAAAVNARAEVAHNYRREHALNMWFVVAEATPEAVEAAIVDIEAATGLEVLRFPKEREFFVELRLPLDADPPPGAQRVTG